MTAAPETIGRYQVLKELGHGAMGMVFLGQDPLLKRKVALKVMRERTPEDDSVLERFRREAEISAQLTHPNVITVYDVGEDPALGPYLAMEYVEGSSLAGLVRSRGLSHAAAFELLSQVMLGLLAAGAQDIIHRDVKPENILVGLDGRVKLSDFGIARGEGTRLTATGMVVGTPSYTAPELIVKTDQASRETDLYAFAVTCFEVMTGGSLPFRGDTLMSVLYHIVHDPPEIPSDLSPALAAVFHKALDKDPKARYPSLPSFMAALAHALGLPVPEVPKGLLAAAALANPASVAPEEAGETATRAIAGTPPDPGSAPAAARDAGGAKLTPPPSDLLRGRSMPPSGPASHPPASPSSGGHGSSHPTPAPGAKATDPRGLRVGGTPPSRPRMTPQRALLATAVVVAAGFLGWQQYQRVATRSVTVVTDPPGAEVFVDGAPVGTTGPGGLTAEVPRGARLLQVDRLHYRSVYQSLPPGNVQLPPMKLQLIEGRIRVYTQPTGATVFLDGRRLTERTPIHGLDLGDGEHQLEVALKGYESWAQKVSVQAPPPEPISLTPTR